MYHETLLHKARQKTTRVLVIGAGEYGVSLVFQAGRAPGLEVAAVCDRDVANAVGAFRHAGWAEDDIAVCDSLPAAKTAQEAGKAVVSDDGVMLCGLPLDVVVEGTGAPEAGAVHAEAALAQGKHVVMVSKEVDSVVGPLFHARARAAGLVYTPVDGDQPALLMQLVMWARVVGLEVLCAGKSSEYDFVYDGAAVTSLERTAAAPGFDDLWDLGGGDATALAAARAEALAAIPRRAVPDHTEMALVANALDLAPDIPEFHAPVARTSEIADFLVPRDRGGLLAGPGVVDVVNSLRRPEEASLAGGVFVVVACEDAATWKVLRAKGHVVNRSGTAALIYRPSHLLGVESATTVLMAALEGRSSGPDTVHPRYDVAGRATRPLKAGTVLNALGHHHVIDGVESLLLPARPAEGANPVPYYLMAGTTLARNVPEGSVITTETIQAPVESRLWALRREMERRFLFPAPGCLMHPSIAQP